MDIRDSIVGIVARSSSEYRFSGTGFFVEGGLILTCAHVAEQAQLTGGKIQFRVEGKKQFHDAEIIFKSPEIELDICVLKPIDFEEEAPALKLIMSRRSEGNTFKAFGYPQPKGFQGLRGDGEILGWVRDSQGRDALHISSDEVSHGYSGCPIWDNEAEGVVGIVSRGFDFGLDEKLGSAVFAIPSEVLKGAYPELKVDEISTPEPIPTWNLKRPYPMPPNFTGRLAERKMLVEWLQNDNENRLFILRALGGFGKSALAWHWLTHDVDAKQWPKVVWWSFYEGNASFEHFIQETLEYLNVEVPPDQRGQVDALLKAMGAQNFLLIMDGFERALRAYNSMNAAYQGDEEPILEDNQLDCVNINAQIFLQKVCSLPKMASKVLVTTRLTPRALKAREELLQGCFEKELMEMNQADAIAFFHKQGINGTHAEIESACEPYGYHPLSLRILVGLIINDRENPGDIAVANQLDITDDIVTNKNHVLTVAYHSLKPKQQKLLSIIACFRTPVTYDALRIISSKSSGRGKKAKKVSTPKLDNRLIVLEERSLLHWDRKTNKYDLHPIVRRYAYDCLTTAKRKSVHKRLADYFEAIPEPENVEKLEDLAPLIELYYHMFKTGDLVGAFILFRDRLSNQLHFQFGAYQLCAELLVALFPDNENKLPRLYDRLYDRWLKDSHYDGIKFFIEQSQEDAQAWALHSLAIAYSASGQPRRAIQLFEKKNEIRKRTGDKVNLAHGLEGIATNQLNIGALREADDNLRHCIKLSREIKSEFNEASSHLYLGDILSSCGAWQEAEEELDAALQLIDINSHVQMQGIHSSKKAEHLLRKSRDPLLSKQKNLKFAIEYAQLAFKLAEKTAKPNSGFVYPVLDFILAYWLLGASLLRNGQLVESEKYLSEALTRDRAINLIDTEAKILLDLANLRYVQKNYEEAKSLVDEALLITERCGYVLQGADVNLFLAQYALEQKKDKAKAKQYAETALELATCDGPPYYYKVAYEEAEQMLKKLEA